MIIETKNGDILAGNEKRIAFAINTDRNALTQFQETNRLLLFRLEGGILVYVMEQIFLRLRREWKPQKRR